MTNVEIEKVILTPRRYPRPSYVEVRWREHGQALPAARGKARPPLKAVRFPAEVMARLVNLGAEFRP